MKSDPSFLIIEDHEVVTAAIELILMENFPKARFRKAGSFPKGTRMLSEDPAADLIILDVDIPGGESYKMIETLRNIQANVKVMIFTGQDEDPHAIRFLKAGANGFLSKNAPLEQCAVAVKLILGGKKYVSDSVQEMITSSFFDKTAGAQESGDSALSPRETEVMELLLLGKWTKDIANELNLNPTTVSTHKARIFQKMDVTNVIDLYKKLNQL
jgi:two-component system invasion response regulator UvrY